jgi:hypothetical protein
MQAKAQAWERGVHVARGALNLLKTFFWINPIILT